MENLVYRLMDFTDMVTSLFTQINSHGTKWHKFLDFSKMKAHVDEN